MEYLQPVSIALEALVAVFAILSAMKRRSYLYGLAVTFGIYVYYDFAKLYDLPISAGILSGMFFVATLTALYSVYNIYKRS